MSAVTEEEQQGIAGHEQAEGVAEQLGLSWHGLRALSLELLLAAMCVFGWANSYMIEVISGPTTTTTLMIALYVLLTAVLAMNGLAKMQLVLHPMEEGLLDPLMEQGRFQPLTRFAKWCIHWIHEISNEPELAGIAVGFFMAIPPLITRGTLTDGHSVHPYHLIQMMATLYGIMSMAGVLSRHMTPFIGLIEKKCIDWFGPKYGPWIGLRAAAMSMALLSSFTGEPAAAIFGLDYFEGRVKPGKAADASVGYAMSIGSGGGLTFFAAPPLLIIWGAYLAGQLGWTLGSLFMYVGLACILYVAVAAHQLAGYLKPLESAEEVETPTKKNWLGIIPMIAIVVPHVVWWKHLPEWMLIVDLCVGIWATHVAAKRTKNASHEEQFAAKWQPAILALLLMMLEFIGLVGDPLISLIGSAIPLWLPLPVIAISLFFLTAWVSHFADNALASRVFIMIPIALIPVVGLAAASYLAVAVILGALFGSELTISANLPNFPIARRNGVSPGEWFKSGLRPKHYATCLVYVGWLLVAYPFMV